MNVKLNLSTILIAVGVYLLFIRRSSIPAAVAQPVDNMAPINNSYGV